MALRVVSFATYLVRVDAVWRDGDYNALKFVKAINYWHGATGFWDLRELLQITQLQN